MSLKPYQYNEILKCGKDPVYFFNKYVKIQHPTKGSIKFSTYDFQDGVVKDFLKHRLNIVLKARQLGLSTITASFALWMVLFQQNTNILVIATDLRTAINFIRKCKFMLNNLPDWLVLGEISSETKQSIETSRGSILKAVPTSDSAGRSEALSLLIIDEAAFIQGFDELWKGLMPTLSCLTEDTLVFTEKGMEYIGDICKDKEVGKFFDLNKQTWGKEGLEDISHGYVSPKSKVLEIETQSGSIIKVTPRHPLYSLKEKNTRPKMIPADFLEVGDHLRFSFDMNMFGNVSVEDDLAYMVGWMHTDKITPSQVLLWNKQSISKYLCGLFDGYGSITENGVILSSISQKLIQETKIILSNFGIYGNIHKSTDAEKKLIYEQETCRLLPQGKPAQSLKDCWSIVIPRSQMSLFSNEIGFNIKRKQDLLNKFKNQYIQDDRKIYQIPKTSIHLIISEIVQKSKKSKKWFRNNGLRLDKILDNNLDRYVNQSFLKRLYELIDHDLREEYKFFFDEFLIGKLRWEKIVKIKMSDEEVLTYDFTVPKTHSFLQNGLLGSNTGGRAIVISCVTKDTWVFTDKGPAQVKSFIQQDSGLGGYKTEEYSVLGKDKFRQGNLFHNNGLVQTKKIRTQHSWLEGSKNHKVWAYSGGKYGWFKLEQLNKGDHIAYQYGMNAWGNNDDISTFSYSPSPKEKNIPKLGNSITKDLSYIFGMYLAEGSNYKNVNKNGKQIGNHLTFTCGDDIKNLFEGIDLPFQTYDNMHYNLSSKSFGVFLEYLGFDLFLNAKNKMIPDRLMQMSKKNIASMLSGIFDGDGYSRRDRGTIGISLSSKKLIEQIRILLNNFGIITDYYEGITPPTEKVKVESQYYRIEINGKYSNLFYDEIGFAFDRKQDNKKMLTECSDLSIKNTKDIVPNSLGILKEIYSYSSENLNTLYKKHDLFMNGILNKKTEYKTNNISRDVCLEFWNVVKKDVVDKSPEKALSIEKIISSNIKWDKIKEIEDGLEETYDFSLPDNADDFWCHSVIYNGMLGHQTPNGTGNKFFEIYDKAVNNANEFNPIRLHWTVHPERDQKWFESATRNMTKKEIAQEHECDFIASGDTFLDGDILKIIKDQIKDPIRREGMDRNIWIWKEPVKDHKYILSADTARGDGKDFSTFHVIDVSAAEVVVEYKGKFPPDRLAEMINEVGLKYNKALVCPENNSVGYATIQKLCALGYPRIYNNKQKTLDMWDSMTVKSGDLQRPSGDLGIFTTGQKKNVMLTKMSEVIRNGLLKVYSERLYREFTTFLWLSTNKVGADRGKNDDLVMSLGIGCWLFDTSDYSQYAEENSKALIDGMTQSTVKLDDIINGQVNSKDNSVFLPVAGNGTSMNDKKIRPQVVSEKWRWLLS
jgi:intein/homing endonuclease